MLLNAIIFFFFSEPAYPAQVVKNGRKTSDVVCGKRPVLFIRSFEQLVFKLRDDTNATWNNEINSNRNRNLMLRPSINTH